MSDLLALDGPRVAPAAGGKPRSLVVLLHGLGADGNDLIGLAPHWQRALPHTAFVSPHAPFPCDMAPYGRQWFSFQDRDPPAILAGVMAAASILDAFLDEELARHALAADRLALVGFSQGTMMSLYVAPRRAARIAGVVGYSGRLVGGASLARDAAA
jgi:phospholipase/carboxylesterase